MIFPRKWAPLNSWISSQKKEICAKNSTICIFILNLQRWCDGKFCCSSQHIRETKCEIWVDFACDETDVRIQLDPISDPSPFVVWCQLFTLLQNLRFRLVKFILFSLRNKNVRGGSPKWVSCGFYHWDTNFYFFFIMSRNYFASKLAFVVG